MEHADRALGAEFRLHQSKNVFEITNESRPIMVVEEMNRVLAVIAEVKKNELVTFAQRAPERQIAVDREAVAVAQGKSRTVRITVLADTDYRAIYHFSVDRSERRRHLDTQFVA